MKKHLSALVIAACVLIVPPARASEALAKPYVLKLGEMVAIYARQALIAGGFSDVPVITFYNRDRQTVGVAVYGTRGTVDGAKESLDKYRAFLTDTFAAMAEGMYGVKLGDSDFTLIYYNHYDKNKELVRRENGQYVIK